MLDMELARSYCLIAAARTSLAILPDRVREHSLNRR